MKDMLNLMDEFLAMGMPVESVIVRATWNPAREIKHEKLGNLSPGSPADVAAMQLERGSSASSICMAPGSMGRRSLFAN
jgi:dihydroorotase